MEDKYIQFEVSQYHLVSCSNTKEYLKRGIEEIKFRGAVAVFEEIYKSPLPVVVETHLEEYDEPWSAKRIYRLHYRLTVVQKADIFTHPPEPFVFTNYSGVVEWKCPYCSVINNIEAAYCGEKHKHAIGCGAQRKKTRQEM